MTKFISYVLSFLLFFDFFGCAALRTRFAEKTGLEMMQAVMVNPVYDENGDLLTCQYELHWKGREYEPYDFGFWADFTGTEYVGKLFGLAVHSRGGTEQVYRAAGQKPEEWLIWSQAQPMGFLLLYKEKSVTEIPEWIVPFGSD